MNEKEEQAYNKAIERLGINPAYQSLIIARLQMEIDDICNELASLFGGTLPDVEYWKRFFYVIRRSNK